jgi:ATP phosphoribosyltransferase regulatory subunit HisZ
MTRQLPAELQSAVQESARDVGQLIVTIEKSGVAAYWQPLAEPRSSYYTGMFFEAYVPGFTEPIARGGVYNELVKRYANIEAGACGFALDLLSF